MILQHPRKPQKVELEEKVYLLRPPTVMDRATYRREILKEGGRKHSRVDQITTLEKGVKEILNGDDPEEVQIREQYLEALQDYRTQLTNIAADMADGEFAQEPTTQDDLIAILRKISEAMAPSQLVQAIERIVSDHYPPYRDMVADTAVHDEIAAIVGVRMFLVGWDGYDEPLRREHGAVTEECMELIPVNHLAALGESIQLMMTPGKKQRGNLPWVFGGSSGQAPSTSTEPSTQPQTTPQSDQMESQMDGTSPI